MLTITVQASEGWDAQKEEFLQLAPPVTLQLEHSLLSLAKWEEKWEKPFLNEKEKTREETLDYVRCMTLTRGVDPSVYNRLSAKNLNDINAYIKGKHTATTIKSQNTGHKGSEFITSELVYYWMVAYQIPFECQKWNLNRLITLVEVCNEKNKPNKKMSQKQILQQNHALNAQRRAAHKRR